MPRKKSTIESAARTFRKPYLLAAAFVALVATTAYGLNGFDGLLQRDDAIYVYSGQQLADGVPPYISVFDHKGPLAPMLCGIAVVFGRWIGADDILSCRVLFFMISILTVVGVFMISEKIIGSLRSALFAALTFVAFWGFGAHAASGPRAKTPMVLLQILALYFTASKRWFWGALFGGLATLTWQPMVVFPLITLILAVLQSHSPKQRFRSAALALGGMFLPIALTMLWFAGKGALGEFIDGWITFNILHLDRDGATIASNFVRMSAAIREGYVATSTLLYLGFLGIVLFAIVRLYAYRGQVKHWLQEDGSMAVILSFPCPFLWSALDFQSYPDFFPFLPYAALGCGWMLSAAIRGIEAQYSLTGRFVPIASVLVLLLLLGISGPQYYRTRNTELLHQRQWAAELNAKIPADYPVLSIGLPQALVLTGRTNPTPFAFVVNGIDNYIDAQTEGGFDGWVRDIDRMGHVVILLGPIRGQHVAKIQRWVEEKCRMAKIGQWTFCVR